MTELAPDLVSGIPVDAAGLFTDLYQLTMAATYFRERMSAPATFSLFIRNLPAHRGFYLAAGITDALTYLQQVGFPPSAIDWLRTTGLFADEFLDFLGTVRFTGDVRAVAEGRMVFANEPVVEVTAPIIEAQIVETFLMNIIHFQTLVASKAVRCVIAADGRPVIDFGMRRTHGADAGMKAARASYLAGFVSTSNVLAGKTYGIPVAGTMAHSFITSFPTEREAFEAYARAFPDRAVLLIDTYDTLTGAHKAVEVARLLAHQGKRLVGVRLDSGDLAALAKGVRRILDDAGFPEVRIFASGGLDEDGIAEMLAAGAPVDTFAVGTRMGVSYDAPAFDIAYKQVAYAGHPVLKLSTGKQTLVGPKQVWREYAADGTMLRDTITPWGESGPPGAEPLLAAVMEGGRPVGEPPSLAESRAFCAAERGRLPAGLRDLRNPARYLVEISASLREMEAAAVAAARARELG